MICRICGALVDDQDLHAQWHEALPVTRKSLELASSRPAPQPDDGSHWRHAVTAVRGLHRQMVWPLCDCDPPHGQVFCAHCLDLSGRHPDAVWPCATIRVLEREVIRDG